MKVRRWIVAVLVLCCAALGLAPTALGKGRVDRSFGKDGVVDLGADLVGDRWLGAMAVAPNGDILFTEEHPICSRGGCPYAVWLKRYRSDGRLDTGFDPGPGPISGATQPGASLTVDSAGRPVLSWQTKDRRVMVRRLLRGGQVDRGFGVSGTVTLDCDCYLGSVTPTPSGGLLIAASSELERKEVYKGAIWTFVRLRSDGSRDPSFGRDGLVRMSMPGYGHAVATPGSGGSSILTGFRCCERYPAFPFVSWLSRNGHLTRHFGETTSHSLHGVPGTKLSDYGWESVDVIPRAHGRIDLYAGTRAQAVAVRLLPDGRRDRSFGRDGVRLIPLQEATAASDGYGGALVAGYGAGGFQVRRVGSDGRIDRRFGRVPLPDAYNEEGLDVVTQGRGSAIVLARDILFCRQVCPSDPKMFRVLR
jgi:hypothetical protein